jgi:AcrR family transcriptional regulator
VQSGSESTLDGAVAGAPTEAAALARMLSIEPDTDDIAERVLDGALAQFCDTGLTRTTMDDVARRSGLSRVTIYRRFENKTALIEAVLLRECRRGLAELERAVVGLPGMRQRLIEGFAFALRFARQHPLVGGLLRLEPQVILPFMTVRSAIPTAVVRAYLAAQLRQARDAGELTTSDVEAVAELMVRIAASFLLNPSSCIPLESAEDMRAFARHYLVPLLNEG